MSFRDLLIVRFAVWVYRIATKQKILLTYQLDNGRYH